MAYKRIAAARAALKGFKVTAMFRNDQTAHLQKIARTKFSARDISREWPLTVLQRGVKDKERPLLLLFTQYALSADLRDPPRVEDLIGGNGTVTEVDPEKSTNLEFGVRAMPARWMSIQAAYFRSDFDNLVAVGSIAGGNTPLSQGKALFEGLELGAQTALLNGVFARLAYTWLPTAEQTEAFRNVASGATIGKAGNRQPYAPKNTLTVAAGYERGAFRGEVEAQYVGTQFTDFANTGPISADGQRGEIDAYAVWNAALNYRFDKSVTGFLALKNITDEAYIVDLTRGIQVGMPRLVQVGMRYGF